MQATRAATRVQDLRHTSNGAVHQFSFYAPNALCKYRADTFSSKEPETLAWIDQYGDGAAFFDIGANIGLYSVYFARTKPGNVYAFEPSVFNLSQLAKNLNANAVSERVRIIANPLTEANQFASFNLTSDQEGAALSAFGVDYGQYGEPLARIFSYQTLGFSLDFMISAGLIAEIPKMIKIDVDGIEHLILRGATATLAQPTCRTVLLEIPEESRKESRLARSLLEDAGFVWANRKESGLLAGIPAGSGFNQIWVKPGE
jgi:FkbM family methyltransferase